jgi:TolB-like protein/Tfp pilus assembly protein PilF
MDSEGPGGPADPPSAPQLSPSVPDADEAAAAAEKKKRKKKAKVRSAWISFAGRIVAQIVGAAATIVLGIYLVTSHRGEPDRAASRVPRVARTLGAEPSLAVLPFDNYSGDASQDYFVNGMTEALIADLARVRGLRVISRTSSMRYQGQKKSLPEIAGELGVDLLVEGSVARSGNRVRITAQLIDGASDEHIWARSYEEKVEDVLTLQSRIATAIAGEVRGAVSSSAAGARRAVDPEVYDLYLRGRNAWNTRSPEGFEQARTYFQQAIDKDPSFALAHAGLADTYQVAGMLSGTSDGPARAREAAERALALDDSLGEAHASLAGTLHRPVADIPRAEAEFKRAIELNPGYATAHQWYAIMLAEEGRDREAMEHAERAVALDPLAGVMQQTLGLVNYFGRRYDRAGADARRALELAPHLTLARQILARSLVERGRAAEAVRLLSEQPATTPEELAVLAIACSRSGEDGRAAAIVKDLTSRDPQPLGALARWYTATGDTNRALAAFEQMAARRPGALQTFKNDPAFERLKSSPRFRQLVGPASN